MTSQENDDLEEWEKLPASGWLWCLHCERVFREFVRDEDCPHEDCDGGGLGFDIFPWEWPRWVNKGYPVIPDPSVEWPLYGESRTRSD